MPLTLGNTTLARYVRGNRATVEKELARADAEDAANAAAAQREAKQAADAEARAQKAEPQLAQRFAEEFASAHGISASAPAVQNAAKELAWLTARPRPGMNVPTSITFEMYRNHGDRLLNPSRYAPIPDPVAKRNAAAAQRRAELVAKMDAQEAKARARRAANAMDQASAKQSLFDRIQRANEEAKAG